MSEQKSFMQQLDEWTRATVIQPLHEAITEGDGEDCDAACEAVMKAIREKVLESYRNGQSAAGTSGGFKSRESSFRPRRREFAK
jgi:hypothetical protein